MLVAEGLTKSYRGHEVVRDVNLRVGPGRIVGLVGANGAGKSTTLKMLAGLLEPTRGAATIDGSPTIWPDSRRRIGYLPEESPLYDEQSALSYLHFFGALYNVPRVEGRRRAEALLKRLNLAPSHWKKPIGTFSKGMRRKVAIARCLIYEPEVLILDEPTSGLDPLTAGELDVFLRELVAAGKGILLSAHNLVQVEQLCDEIVVMHGGRIVTRGTLAELRGRIGTQRYQVRATVPFPGSKTIGTVEEAWLTTLREVEDAIDHVRKHKGIVLEVESVPPKLEDILRHAAQEEE